MKFLVALTVGSLLAAPLAAALPHVRRADTYSLSYDTVYDNTAGDLSSVACSDGSNGLVPLGYKTFGDLPSFANVGAVPAITGWNSPFCGTCWEITYNGTSIYLTGIDAGKGAFVTSQAAENSLTNGMAAQLGRISVTAAQVGKSKCNL